MSRGLYFNSHIILSRTLRTMDYGLHWSYAEKNGGPILREQKQKWKYINGIFLNTNRYTVWILFRRVWRLDN